MATTHQVVSVTIETVIVHQITAVSTASVLERHIIVGAITMMGSHHLPAQCQQNLSLPCSITLIKQADCWKETN